MGKISQKFKEKQKDVVLWHLPLIFAIIMVANNWKFATAMKFLCIYAIYCVVVIAYLIIKFRCNYKNGEIAIEVNKRFGEAVSTYRDSTDEKCVWNDGETEFRGTNGELLFEHHYKKGGYYHKYFSDSTDAGSGKATKFTYLSFPVTYAIGRRAFYIDEKLEIFEMLVKDKKALWKLIGICPNFSVPAGKNRFTRYGLMFVLK